MQGERSPSPASGGGLGWGWRCESSGASSGRECTPTPTLPRRRGRRRLLTLAFLLLAAPALAAVGDPAERLPDPAQEARAQALGRELRCMVCQNQSIEDSDADLARDLRRIVREQVGAGRSNEQVMRFLHERYGDFVLLRPPVNAATAILWAMPAIALGGGALMILAARRRRVAQLGSSRSLAEPAALSPAEQARLARLDGSGGAAG